MIIYKFNDNTIMLLVGFNDIYTCVVPHNIHPVSALPQRLNNSIFILILRSCIVNLIISTQLDVSGVRRGQQRIAVAALQTRPLYSVSRRQALPS